MRTQGGYLTDVAGIAAAAVVIIPLILSFRLLKLVLRLSTTTAGMRLFLPGAVAGRQIPRRERHGKGHSSTHHTRGAFCR